MQRRTLVPFYIASRVAVFSAAFAGIFLFPGPIPVSSHAAAVLPAIPADQFVREVLTHELAAQADDHSLWCFHELKTEDGLQKLLHVCQTKEGQIERLIALNGQPLTAKQSIDEDRRIRNLLHDAGELKARRKKEREDAEQAHKLLKLFPQAFRYQYDGLVGSLVRVRFVPNAQFHPSGHSEQVFHHMEGTLLLDPVEKRLAAIDGKITSEVKFFGGLLGYLDKGGTFSVKQENVGCHYWEVTLMNIRMSGKALFFKTIGVRTFEQYTDFKSSPSGFGLAQAAERLMAGVEPSGNSDSCSASLAGS